MSKQPANISLSKVFKEHKSKKKIFYLVRKDKDLIDLFINFSNFGEYKRDKGFKGILQLIIEQQLSVASANAIYKNCLLYTSPSPRDAESSRMPSAA